MRQPLRPPRTAHRGRFNVERDWRPRIIECARSGPRSREWSQGAGTRQLEGATAGEVKLHGQAGEPAAAEAQLELAVAGGGGGVDCCPAAAACTSTSTGASSSTAGGGAADRLQFERGWATKYATRKKTEPERYSQFDLD